MHVYHGEVEDGGYDAIERQALRHGTDPGPKVNMKKEMAMTLLSCDPVREWKA